MSRSLVRRAFLVAGAVFLLLPLIAHARSGGGQNYASGSSSSSSSSGGGGNSGLVWLLLNLLINYPQIGIPVVIAIAIYFIVKWASSPDRKTRQAIESKAAAESVTRDLSGLTQLKASDPGFDLDRFTAGVRTIVNQVNNAWCAARMEPARRYVSDAVYVRFRTQLAINTRAGLRNTVANFEIVNLLPIAMSSDGVWDTIHVKLEAKARDVDVPVTASPEEVQKRAASAPLEPYFEIWTMARRSGAQTPAAGGVLEGRCANCGADVPAGETVRCEFCKTLVNGGTHDWVLAAITQMIEWSHTTPTGGKVPGFDELRLRDPGFNRARVEDQASLLFWKWIEARVLGDARRLARYTAVPPASLGVGVAEAIDRAAVGAVDLAACDAVSDGVVERAYVRVIWSAAASRSAEPVNQTNVLILSRKVGVTTGPGRAALVCRDCSGALDESDAIQCQFCGAKIGPGDQDWALESVATPYAAENARQSRLSGQGAPASWEDALDVPDLADPRAREALAVFMARVLMADGVIAPAERKLLNRVVGRWSINKARLDALIAVPPSPADAAQLAAMTPDDKVAFLGGLVVAALVDGTIDARERALLDGVCRALGLPPATVDDQIRKKSMGRVVAAA